MIDFFIARRAWAVFAACILGLLSTLSAHAATTVFPATETSAPRALVVVDADVPEPEVLFGAGGDYELLRLPAGGDGLQAIAEKLRSMGGARAVHVVAHGAAGGLTLAGEWIGVDTLHASVDALAAIRAGLGGGEIQLYACEVAAGERGRGFVDALAGLTGATVAASTTLVGSAERGGNWELDYRTGALDEPVPFTTAALEQYGHVLTHGRGGSITWQPKDLDGDGQLNDVEITVKTGWRFDFPSTFSLNISPALPNGASSIAASSQDLIYVNGDDSDADYALRTSVFLARDLDPNTRYLISMQVCCRISNLQNNADGNGRIEGEIFMADGNLAPKIDLPIIFQVPQKNPDDSVLQHWSFALKSSDPNADKLRYRLATSAEMGGGGQSNPPGLSINPNTGMITWTDSGTRTVGLYSAAIVAEDLDNSGNRKSKTMVDFILELVNSSQTQYTVPTVAETRNVFVRKGESFTFEIDGVAINTQSLGNLQGALTANGNEYTFTPGGEGEGLDPGTYPITFEVRSAGLANNYLVVNYRVPDPHAPWVENLEGLRVAYASDEDFEPIAHPGGVPALELSYSGGAHLNGGQMKVNVTFVDGDYEVLGVLVQGDGAGEINVVGNDVFYAGDLIGVIDAVQDGVGRPLLINFTTEHASVEAVQALVRSLQYKDTFELREEGDRSLSLYIRDADGRANSYDFYMNVTAHSERPASGPPMEAANRITLIDGETIVLSDENIKYADPEGRAITINVDAVENGRFEYAAAPGVAITSFSQEDITLGRVAFVHTEQRQAPGYTITASALGESAPASVATVNFTSNLFAPTISGVPATQVLPDEAYAFTPVAADEDLAYGDVLNFTIANRPSWASFNTATGELTGTPGLGDRGLYSGIVITVRDSGGLAASLPAFDITVGSFSGGGTTDDPYVISGPQDIHEMPYFHDAHFVLAEDLDLSGEEWTPVGTDLEPFTGSLKGQDGEERVITGLDGKPFFGVVGPGAEISDIRIVDNDVNRPGTDGVGVLADKIIGTGGDPAVLTNVVIDGGTVTGGDNTGGVAGVIQHAQLDNVVSSAEVNGDTNVGGIGGSISDSQLSDVVSYANVSGSGDNIGGVAGYFSGGSYAEGYATGSVTSTGSQAGGLIGHLDGGALIERGYATGAVSGAGNIGGLIGNAEGASVVRDVYATGSTSASAANVGSLIGRIASSTLTRGYGLGAVSGSGGGVGGLVGADDGATVEHSYWNTQSTGQVASAAGDGRDTSSMRHGTFDPGETYMTWTFGGTPWGHSASYNNGYPYLAFAPVEQVTVNSPAHGSVSGAGNYPDGSTVVLTLTPDAGYKVHTVTGCGGTLSGNTYTIPVFNQGCSVTVSFTLDGPLFDPTTTLELDAESLFTEIPLGAAPKAVDAFGNELEVSLVGVNKLRPGRHTITWRAVDGEDVANTTTQQVDIWPTVSLSKDVIVGYGGTGSFQVVLNGAAPEYPYTVAYTVSGDAQLGTHHDLANGSVTFNDGTEATVNFQALDQGGLAAERQLLVELDSAERLGLRSSLMIRLVSHNVAAVVDLAVEQGARAGKLVARDGGPVELQALITDPNPNDTHTVEWIYPHGASVTVNGDTLSLNPTSLPVGVHVFEVVVTDSGNPPQITRAQVRLAVVATAPVLDAANDSNDNGIMDDVEGWADSGNGIPAYLNRTFERNVLPEDAHETDRFLIEGEPGVRLRLGAWALMNGAGGARLSDEAIAGFLGPDEVVNVGGYFDFEATELPEVGQSVRITIPQRAVIPANPVYRKWEPRNGWYTFVENANNALHSAPGEEGYCPAAGSDAYQPGLIPGYWCVQLTLEDGGPNDADGQANGTVVDPGGVGALFSTRVSGKSGGGAAGLWLLMLLLPLVLVRRPAAGWRGLALGALLLLPLAAGAQDHVPASEAMRGSAGGASGDVSGAAIAPTAHVPASEVMRRGVVVAPAVQAASSMAGGPVPASARAPDAVGGWYAGATVGAARGSVDAAEVDSRMAARGYTTETSMSGRTRIAGMLYGGYRWDRLAVEGGYTNLGNVSTETEGLTASTPEVLRDFRDAQPESGHGLQLSLVGYMPLGPSLEAYARGGVFYWRSTMSAHTDGQGVSQRANDLAPTLGLGVQHRINADWQLRGGWDAYRLEGENIHFIGVGVVYRLP